MNCLHHFLLQRVPYSSHAILQRETDADGLLSNDRLFYKPDVKISNQTQRKSISAVTVDVDLCRFY